MARRGRPLNTAGMGTVEATAVGAPPGLAAQIRQQLEARRQTTRYLRNPTGWLKNRTTAQFWSKQQEIANAVVRYPRVSVRSAHDTGKSFTAAQLTAWWLSVHPIGSAFVVTTAPTAPQVEVILWREIGKVKRQANLPGRITAGNIPKWKTTGDEIIAYGRKPADLKNATEAAQAFQGIHARYILVIMDEACGIPEWLWDAVETIATNKFARVLAIGNPDVPETRFEKTHLPTSNWHSIKISAFDTPAFTGEDVPRVLLTDLVSPDWVKAREEEWGVQSPLYMSKVLAEFPEVSEETLIHPRLIQMAQFADRSPEALRTPGRFALDVARSANKNENACYRNRGGQVRLEFANYEPNTMRTAGRATRLLNRTSGAAPMIIDTVGVGGGVYDRLKEQNFPVQAFVASEAPALISNRKRFVNRRSEQWWNFRKQFENGLIDLPGQGEDDKLISQLMSIRYIIRSDGKILVESKEDMEDRGLPSPDRADAAMMACAENASKMGDFYVPPPKTMAILNEGRDPTPEELIESLTGDLLQKVW
jgi:hypothetical protein